jgi:thiamine biosynthesis lipoprotein
MGTLFRIKLYAETSEQANAGFRAAFARIAQLDETLSDYKPGSELNTITMRAVHSPVRVSKDLFTILAASQELSMETDGAFDVTVGLLTHLWRAARRQNRLPDQTELASALALTGYRKFQLNPAKETVEFDIAGMQLDAGGIAKGYAADEALAVLTSLGIHSALVAASGDLAFSNAPPDEPGWRVGLDSFDSPGSPFTRILSLSNAAVSTSGPDEQNVIIGGVRYSHIIDPATGLGLTRPITVTVVAQRGIDADCFATAISVLGAARGLSFIAKQPTASALILTSKAGKAFIQSSAHFPGNAAQKQNH